MRSGMDYGPDQLKVLQQIFDSVWLKLQQEGKVSPDDEAMRQYVSASVMAFANEDVLDVESIKTAVLGLFRKPR